MELWSEGIITSEKHWSRLAKATFPNGPNTFRLLYLQTVLPPDVPQDIVPSICYMGVHPFLPCNLAEATFLCPKFQPGMSTTDLLAARTRQLAKMPSDLVRAKKTLAQSRFHSKEAFEQKFGRRLIKEAHKTRSLVLVRNVPLENTMAIDRKTQCRYMGPYRVVRRTQGKSYILEELDGSELRTSVAAFRLIPYLKREELGKWKRRIDLRDQIRLPRNRT